MSTSDYQQKLLVAIGHAERSGFDGFAAGLRAEYRKTLSTPVILDHNDPARTACESPRPWWRSGPASPRILVAEGSKGDGMTGFNREDFDRRDRNGSRCNG